MDPYQIVGFSLTVGSILALAGAALGFYTAARMTEKEDQ